MDRREAEVALVDADESRELAADLRAWTSEDVLRGADAGSSRFRC